MTITVLLADDRSEVREALGALVESERDLRLVGAAADAQAAIELAQRTRPDVALVDYKMPAGGGPRIVRELRRLSPGTRVVALSAYDDRRSVLQMLSAGAVGYLVKGAPAEEVLAMIRRAACGETVLSPQAATEVVRELAGQLEREERAEARRRSLVARIQEAIEAGPIPMAFQPIVELASGRAVGFEALARLPGKPPDAWFRDADSVGLLAELELAAARSALARLDRVPGAAFVSINIDPRALLSPPVVDALRTADLRRVVIEVTEHARVDDYEALADALRELRAEGARLAIDDAGAGFASLRHVLRLAPDLIKIDGSLVRELDTRAARALARSLIAFAAEMGETVIAEGVEDEGTVAVLRELGVEYAQGFHLGPPRELR